MARVVKKPRSMRNDVLAGLRTRVRGLAEDSRLLAERLDRLVSEIDALRGAPAAGGAAASAGPDHRGRPGPPTVRALRCDEQSDGTVLVEADLLPRLRLPPAPGVLFVLLARVEGREIGDRVVGFKSATTLRAQLTEKLERPIGRRALIQIVYRLRESLGRACLDGERLIEYRAGFGYRVRVRGLAQAVTGEDRR
jgi:hypothetical protein